MVLRGDFSSGSCARIKEVRVPIEACEIRKGRVLFGVEFTLEGEQAPTQVMRSYVDFWDLRQEFGPFTPLVTLVPFPRANSLLWQLTYGGLHEGAQVDALRGALERWLQAVVAHALIMGHWEQPLRNFVSEGCSAREDLPHLLSRGSVPEDFRCLPAKKLPRGGRGGRGRRGSFKPAEEMLCSPAGHAYVRRSRTIPAGLQ